MDVGADPMVCEGESVPLTAAVIDRCMGTKVELMTAMKALMDVGN